MVFLAFQVLGGGPENAIFSVLLIYAHSLYLAKNEERGFRQKTLGVLALGVAALALSALQWIPTYHLLQETGRSGGLSLAASTIWSLEPGALLELFLPENFSHFLEQDGGNMSYFVHGFYMGIVPLFVLSGCLLVGREQKPIRFWLTVFGVGVFFALGKFNPLYSLFGCPCLICSASRKNSFSFVLMLWCFCLPGVSTGLSPLLLMKKRQ